MSDYFERAPFAGHGPSLDLLWRHSLNGRPERLGPLEIVGDHVGKASHEMIPPGGTTDRDRLRKMQLVARSESTGLALILFAQGAELLTAQSFGSIGIEGDRMLEDGLQNLLR